MREVESKPGGAGVLIERLKVWRNAKSEPVLDGITLELEPGERVAVAGPNGAGKTTLLLALVGAAPFEGRISIGRRTLDRESLVALRREIGFVFADPQDQLFLPTVREEVAYGLRQRGLGETEIAKRIGWTLERVGLAGFEQRAPLALSLGEQRRLAVATALAVRPALILLDEPTASLDSFARRSMIETLRATESTVLLATHDLDALLDLEARVVLLGQKRVVGDGPAQAVLTDEALLERAGLGLPLTVAARRSARR